jgi:hypothetical protein
MPSRRRSSPSWPRTTKVPETKYILTLLKNIASEFEAAHNQVMARHLTTNKFLADFCLRHMGAMDELIKTIKGEKKNDD